MTQAKAPREFKFVGAFSRKHQRRRGANKTSTTTSTTPSKASQAPGPPTPAPSDNASNNAANNAIHQQADQAAANVLMDMQIDHGEPVPAPAVEIEQSNATDTAIPTVPNLDELGDLGLPADVANWYFDPPFNLFTDFDSGFSMPNDLPSCYCKIPFFPDPSGVAPFEQLEDSPSTDASNAGARSTVHQCDGGAVSSEAVQMLPPDQTEAISLPSNSIDGPGGNISHTISQLLTRYDKEFCVLPLTHDFEANPFRFDSKTGRGSQLLLHCILAVCYKHISRDTGAYGQEAKTHKRKAFEMLKDLENHDGNPVHANSLDALLILMTLDCATSARGPWMWYLQRAHKMIQATASQNVAETPRIQARIEMLVWWDVTLALTSRQGCVLSESTTMSLLAPANAGGSTQFFSISGCPRELFTYMIRLAAFAREFEVVNNMTCVYFDMKHIRDIRQSIQAWKNDRLDESIDDKYGTEVAPVDTMSVVDLQNKEDLYHCAEAWRYALLVYIERVFNRSQITASSMLEFLARRTINHVTACRRSSMVQKQLLLPVFLAGCETSDHSLQDQARDYCNWWDERTRYGMFATATGLLEEIWTSNDSSLWWGAILDQKARDTGSAQVPRQYLFG